MVVGLVGPRQRQTLRWSAGIVFCHCPVKTFRSNLTSISTSPIVCGPRRGLCFYPKFIEGLQSHEIGPLCNQSRKALMQAPKLSSALQCNGKEINDHKGKPQAEILFSDCSTLLQVRPSTRIHARLQSVSHLFPRRGPRRQHSRN